MTNRFTQRYPTLKPQEVSLEIVIKWRSYILETAISTTYNTYARHMRSLFNFGIEYGFLQMSKNPFVGTFIRDGKKKRKILTEQQLKEIQEFLLGDDLPQILRPRWFILTIIYTFRYTGIRRSQLLKLRVKDLDIDRKVLIIPAKINKNHNYHEIPISQKLIPHLRKMLFELRKLRVRDDEQLFNINLFSKAVIDKKTVMTKHQLQHLFVVISKRVGFKVTPHRFRHTIATQLMKNPENLYSVQKLLNHSDLKVTLSYVEYDCEMIRNCIEQLE